MKKTRKKRSKHANFILALLIIFMIYAFRWDIAVRTYTFDSGKNKNFVRILLVADSHSSYYGDKQSELIKAIDKTKPDIILLGGDICDDKAPHERTWELLENIAERYPCYYAAGNHEYWSGEIAEIKDKMRSYGVDVIENDKRVIEFNGTKINLYGIEDPEYFNSWDVNDKWAQALEQLNSGVDTAELNVLLSHRPDGVEYYKNTDFDISLCGHAHGGQVRIPFVLNGLYAPNQGFFPKYAGGRYDFENHTMIVSRGLCRNTLPRFFNRPELVVVDVR